MGYTPCTDGRNKIKWMSLTKKMYYFTRRAHTINPSVISLDFKCNYYYLTYNFFLYLYSLVYAHTI
jgi:hypothetical protein